jgi:peptidoglycan hydrolase-like protein with peptidoglycan-binding domain
MRGAIVRRVQRAFKAAGVHPGKIDGLYGPQTVAAVNAFQIMHGLVADGEVGLATARELGVDFPS